MTQCSEVLTPFGAVMVWVVLFAGVVALLLVVPWLMAAMGWYWRLVERVTGGGR